MVIFANQPLDCLESIFLAPLQRQWPVISTLQLNAIKETLTVPQDDIQDSVVGMNDTSEMNEEVVTVC